MTDYGRRKWTEALQDAQQRRDDFIRTDWRTAIDWAELGRSVPPEKVSDAEIERATGSTQSVPGNEAANGTITLKNHAIIHDYFPAGHIPFLMDVLTHPQMLQLHQMLLGSERILLDHNTLLNRKPGYGGGNFHSHPMATRWSDMGAMDGGSTCHTDTAVPTPIITPAEYDQTQPNFVLSLCYPEGFAAGEDGGLKLIPGSVYTRERANAVAALTHTLLLFARTPSFFFL